MLVLSTKLLLQKKLSGKIGNWMRIEDKGEYNNV